MNTSSAIDRCLKPCSTVTLSAKADLIRLTPYHWQPSVLNFRDIKKDDFAIFLAE